jgi:hypothetical protein
VGESEVKSFLTLNSQFFLIPTSWHPFDDYLLAKLTLSYGFNQQEIMSQNEWCLCTAYAFDRKNLNTNDLGTVKNAFSLLPGLDLKIKPVDILRNKLLQVENYDFYE